MWIVSLCRFVPKLHIIFLKYPLFNTINDGNTQMRVTIPIKSINESRPAGLMSENLSQLC